MGLSEAGARVWESLGENPLSGQWQAGRVTPDLAQENISSVGYPATKMPDSLSCILLPHPAALVPKGGGS